MTEEFCNLRIDEENCFSDDGKQVSSSNLDDFENQMIDMDVIQLKNNAIPRGLVPLEKLFDQNDVVKNPKVVPTKVEV